MDTLIETLVFLILGALLLATLAVAVGALRSARRLRGWVRIATSCYASTMSGLNS